MHSLQIEDTISAEASSEVPAKRTFFAQANLNRPDDLPSEISSVYDEDGEPVVQQKYVRMYSCWTLILFGCGNTIGCGIFAYTGLAAQYAGGPAVWLSYVVAGFASLMTALVYAEFGSRFPKSGSSYYYSSMFQGEGISWIIAWNLNLRYGCYAATISRAWGSYFMKLFKLFGINLPKALNNYEYGPFDFSIIAPLCMLLCCWLQNRGSKNSRNTNTFLTGCKLTVLLFIVGVSLANFSYKKNFTPLISPTLGFKGIIMAGTRVFFAYIGFDFITTVSEETVNPQKEVPRAIMGALALVGFFYISVSFSVNGVMNLSEVLKKNGGDTTTALVDIFEYQDMKWMTFVITVAALFGLMAVILSSIMGQARVMRSLAMDGLLPKIFAELDPETKVPVKGAWISTIGFALVASCLNLDVLCTLVSVGNLLSYVIVNCASIQMRLAQKPTKKSDGFKHYLTKVTPWLSVVFCLTHSIILADGLPMIYQWIVLGLIVINFIIMFVLVQKVQNKVNSEIHENLIEDEDELKPYTFMVPLMPLCPVLGMWVNCILCMYGSTPFTWILLGIFESVGFLCYVCYGYRHSKLSERIKKHLKNKKEQDDKEE